MSLLLLLLACNPEPPPPLPRAEPVAPVELEDPEPLPPTPPLTLDAPWAVRTPQGEGKTVDPADYLVEVPCPELASLDTDPHALTRLAEATLRWRAAHFPERAGPGLLGAVPSEWLDEALRRVAAGDAVDPTRRAQAFRCVAWMPDKRAAAGRDLSLPEEHIRLTRYVAWRVHGRERPSGPYDTALYAVPEDERGVDRGELGRKDLLRNRYTRKEVLDGVFEPGGEAAGRAKPLVWLTREDVHEALMQGTVIVTLPDGTERTFNVHRNNGRLWSAARAANPEEQDRYWYFREVPGVLGFGDEDQDVVEAGVIVAGDVPNLGLGVPMLLKWREGDEERGRVVILADTGGAFQPNLYQLDWLVGTFADRESFAEAARAVPEHVEAIFMVPREPGT